MAVVTCVCVTTATAQQTGFFVPRAGKVYFSGDTATIFSNVMNQGKMGVDKNAVLNFKGKKWQNDADGLITDEGNKGEDASGLGGWIRFNGDSIRQEIDGGYNAVTRTGAMFPNLTIQNAAGVELTGSTTKIRHALHFDKGHVFLNDHTLVMGDGKPGVITGFDSYKYIITGSAGSGVLVRENVRNSDSWIIFPIGTRESAYTPAAVRTSATQGDDFHARVNDGVQKDLFSGDDLRDISVNKTWEIGKRNRPGTDDVELSLQHLIDDEGSFFGANRRYSYISQYRNGWDTSYPQNFPTAGTLTTGPPMPNSALNTRSLSSRITYSSYFTKLAVKGDTTVQRTMVWLNAYRKDPDDVYVYWNTNPEVNVRYFVVERRLSNETEFKGRDSLLSRAVNGYSNVLLNYNTNDDNAYTGISYYRLKLVDYSGAISYSNIVPVGGKPGGFQLLLWPNPARRHFTVGINGAVSVKYVVIWNVLGQLIHREPVNDRTVIPMYLYLPGTYMIGFISTGGQILETKRLVLLGEE